MATACSSALPLRRRRRFREASWSCGLAFALAALVSIPAQAQDQDAARQATPGNTPAASAPSTSPDEDVRLSVRALPLATPLNIDGLLSEPVYEQVAALTNFIQTLPHEGEPAAEQTEAWVFFDAENLYVSARCGTARPERMIANEMRRDSSSITSNDNFMVMLDTFLDRRNGVVFQTNPLGALLDRQISDERLVNDDWNTVWSVRTAQSAQGWTLEMVIPFKSLRYRRAGAQAWGINLRRVNRTNNEYSSLTPLPASYGIRAYVKFSSAANLVGLQIPSNSRTLEVKPYVISTLATDRVAQPAFSNDVTGNGGLDVKYGVTRGLVLDVSVNTDFAQVEQDEQQVNLSRFSLFFPEKREFFLEGQDLFSFGSAVTTTAKTAGVPLPASVTPSMFFSRRIGLAGTTKVPIRAGARLTGRAGPFGVGALSIQTGESENGLTPTTHFNVLRLQRDVLRRSSIGLIGVRRSVGLTQSGSNSLLGIDSHLAFFENVSLNSYYARTWTPGSQGTGREAASYRTAFEYTGDRYAAVAERLSVGKSFNPEVGFLRREDFQRTFGLFRFSPRPRKSAVRQFATQLAFDHITDNAGTLQTREVTGSLGAEFNAGDEWQIEYKASLEDVQEAFVVADTLKVVVGEYRFNNVRGDYNMGPQRRVSGTLSLGRGGFYGGDHTEAGYRGRVVFSPSFFIEPGLTINWIRLPGGRATSRLSSARLTYALSPQTAFTLLVQHNSGKQTLGLNARFRWEYHPGSDLFVVVTDGRLTDERGFPRLTNRSVAVKLTRLLRF